MDPLNQRRREPAYEDTQAYRDLCARNGTTPIVRPADGLAYVGPALVDDPALSYKLADLDPQAAAFTAYRTNS